MAEVLAELRAGRKQTIGCGSSSCNGCVRLDGLPPRTSTASVLSRRLGLISDIPCLPIVWRGRSMRSAGVSNRFAMRFFGSPDDLKFRSSMTLFSEAAAEDGEQSGSLLSVSLPANQIIVPSNSLAAATTRRVPQRSVKSRERLPLSTWAVTTTCAWRPPWHPCRRARPGATVSMPLTWTQVQSNLGSKRFTVRTVPALLAKASAWEDYCDGQHRLEQAIKRLGKHKAAA